MNVPIYLRNEVCVEASQEILPGLGDESKEGIIGIQDGASIGDYKGTGIRHQDLILPGNILIEDDTQEELETILEFLQFLVILPSVSSILSL